MLVVVSPLVLLVCSLLWYRLLPAVFLRIGLSHAVVAPPVFMTLYPPTPPQSSRDAAQVRTHEYTHANQCKSTEAVVGKEKYDIRDRQISSQGYKFLFRIFGEKSQNHNNHSRAYCFN